MYYAESILIKDANHFSHSFSSIGLIIYIFPYEILILHCTCILNKYERLLVLHYYNLKPVQNSHLPLNFTWFQSNTFPPFWIWILNSCLTNLTVQIKSSDHLAPNLKLSPDFLQILCKICLQFISSVLTLSNSCLEFKLKKAGMHYFGTS